MANIVIMPGGFHPFHAGHAALYNSIKKKYGEGSDIYVAASNNQKERPFPFEIKEKLAQLSGVQPGEFVQVKSPFVPREITDKYDPDKDTIVFVRSEKDKDEFPKPGSVKKDGSPGYFQHIDTAKRGAQPFSKVGYMDYLPVKEFAGITSATQIRDTWPSLNDDQREEFITHIYPKLKGNDKLIKNVVKLLSKGMSLNEGLAYIDKDGNRVDYTRPDLPTNIRELVINWFNDRDRYTKATLKQKGYTVDIDDKFNNIDIVDKKGRKFTVKVDDAMDDLIQQAYAEPINEAFMDPENYISYRKSMAPGINHAKAILLGFIKANGFNLRGIKTRRSPAPNHQFGLHDYERIMNASIIPDRKVVTQQDIDNLSNEFKRKFPPLRGPHGIFEVSLYGNEDSSMQVISIYPVIVKDKNIDEAFVDPDQSKQYWNHDAQKVGVGGQIEFPLTDKPNLNGRRQGFNEGEERSIIRDAAINALVNAFEGLADEFESREAIEANIYNELSNLSVEDIVDPEMDHHGQRMGNFASGRVIDVVDSSSVIDEVLQQINYFDPADDRNYVSEGVGKDIALGALTLGALAGGVGANDITYDDLFNKYYTAEVEKMEQRGYNLTDRDADGYNPSLKRSARRIAKLKAQQEIQKLSPADSPIAKQIEKTRTELPQPNFDNYMPSRMNESIDKIRGMIKETTDEQKSKSVDLHRKLFELFEEERGNVVKLRGFGREVDKPIPDINKVRAEKEKEQERENNYYSERRAEQEELLARLQAELLNAKQEFVELADAQLLPVEMLDTMENIDKLIDFIENWEGSEEQNNFPFTESILEKLQLKTVQLKEYFGGMRDRQAPRVLRKQDPKLDINSFWNTTDLTETADYIEEK